MNKHLLRGFVAFFFIFAISLASSQTSTLPANNMLPCRIIVSGRTEAALRAAITKAKARITATGQPAIIMLPDYGSSGLTITSPIGVPTQISFSGVTPTFTHSGNVPDNDITFTGGTWIKGDGTFPCFQAQKLDGTVLDTDKGSPDANFTTNCVKGVTIENIGIQNCSRAFSFGAQNQMGMEYCTVRNIWMTGCQGTAFFQKNFMHCDFSRLWSYSNQNGYFFGADVATAVLQPGNSTISQIFEQAIGLTTANARKHRSIVFNATSGSNLNEIMCFRIQSNNGGNRAVTTYTATSQSTNTATFSGKGSELQVGMSIKFTSAGGNGSVTVGQTAFIKTISTDTLTFSDTRGGSAIGGTFTSAPAFTTYGWASMEVVGEGTGGGAGTITNSVFENIDLENVAQSALSIENTNSCHFLLNELYTTSGEQHFVARTSQPNTIVVPGNTFATDIDGSSVNCILIGTRDTANSKQQTGQWWGKSAASGRYTLGIGNADFGVRVGNFEQRQPSGGQFTYPLAGLGQRVHGDYGGGTGSSINAGQAGVIRFTASGTTAITINLPTIDASTVGLIFIAQNNRAGGGTPIVNVTAQGSQYINAINLKTVVALAGPSGSTIAGATFIACDDGAGGNFYWRVILEAGATIP